jgi:putative acetyltransferase
MTMPERLPVTVQPENPFSVEAARLIEQLSAELGWRYGDDGSGAFAPADVDVPGGVFLIARLDGLPVGCGALRPMEPGTGEIKRMYVAREVRGRGVARCILDRLEAQARELGYRMLRLETGTRQPEAIRLYESAGYRRVPCYGCYVDNPQSVCFEKELLSR